MRPMSNAAMAPPVAVRVADAADLSALVGMVEAFLRDTSYGTAIEADRRVITANVGRFIDGEIGRMFVATRDGQPVGLLAATVYVNLLTGRRDGSEIVWWVDPKDRRSGAGMALLKVAEAWMCEQGAEASHLVAWNDRLVRVYGRMGYLKMETVCRKALTTKESPCR